MTSKFPVEKMRQNHPLFIIQTKAIEFGVLYTPKKCVIT